MFIARKIISSVLSIAFLFNVSAYDISSNAAIRTDTKTNNLSIPLMTSQDRGRIGMTLIGAYLTLKKSGLVDSPAGFESAVRSLNRGLLSNASQKSQTATLQKSLQDRGIQIFFNTKPKTDLPGAWFRCWTLDSKGKRIATYYANILPNKEGADIKDTDIKVYTKAEFEALNNKVSTPTPAAAEISARASSSGESILFSNIILALSDKGFTVIPSSFLKGNVLGKLVGGEEDEGHHEGLAFVRMADGSTIIHYSADYYWEKEGKKGVKIVLSPTGEVRMQTESYTEAPGEELQILQQGEMPTRILISYHDGKPVIDRLPFLVVSDSVVARYEGKLPYPLISETDAKALEAKEGSYKNSNGILSVSAQAVVRESASGAVQASGIADSIRPGEDIEAYIQRLLASLTLEEKVAMLHDADGKDFDTCGVPGKGIPPISFTDGPHVVRFKRDATALSSGVGLAATFNRRLLRRCGEVLGGEARVENKTVQLGPAVNIISRILGGRNFEYMTEDPYLAAILARNYVNGVQSQGVAACPKHLAVNSFELNRFGVDVRLSQRALHEIYLPAFKAAVSAGALSVMAAYNKLTVDGAHGRLVDGRFCCTNPYLLDDILKKEWGFKGFAVSDWGGINSTAEAARTGIDLEMSNKPWHPRYMADEYLKFLRAHPDDKTLIDNLNDKVTRVLRVLGTLGMLPGQTRPPYKYNPVKNREVAYQTAIQGIVLLQNMNDLLPLDARKLKSLGIKRIVIVGDNANEKHAHGGGSSGSTIEDEITPREYLEKVFGKSKGGMGLDVVYERGYPNLVQIPDRHLRNNDGQPGWSESTVSTEDGKGNIIVRTATLTAPKAGEYAFELEGPHASFSIFTGDNKETTICEHQTWAKGGTGVDISEGTMRFEKGKAYKLEIKVYQPEDGENIVLGWRTPGDRKISRADTFASAVREASKPNTAVIYVGGVNHQFEAETQDRPNMKMPFGQDRLISALAQATGGKIIVVCEGMPVEMPWIGKVPAVLQAFYGGAQRGRAEANIISGEANPSGRLPVTVPKKLAHSPAHDPKRPERYDKNESVYSEGIFVGYRATAGAKTDNSPLFPFGHGLSYTTFEYSNLQVKPVGAGKDFKVIVSVDVKNTGKRAGYEAVQLYLHDKTRAVTEGSKDEATVRPDQELKGFDKVWLRAGETKTVKMVLDRESLAFFHGKEEKWVADGVYELRVGGTSATEIISGQRGHRRIVGSGINPATFTYSNVAVPTATATESRTRASSSGATPEQSYLRERLLKLLDNSSRDDLEGTYESAHIKALVPSALLHSDPANEQYRQKVLSLLQDFSSFGLKGGYESDHVLALLYSALLQSDPTNKGYKNGLIELLQDLDYIEEPYERAHIKALVYQALLQNDPANEEYKKVLFGLLQNSSPDDLKGTYRSAHIIALVHSALLQSNPANEQYKQEVISLLQNFSSFHLRGGYESAHVSALLYSALLQDDPANEEYKESLIRLSRDSNYIERPYQRAHIKVLVYQALLIAAAQASVTLEARSSSSGSEDARSTITPPVSREVIHAVTDAFMAHLETDSLDYITLECYIQSMIKAAGSQTFNVNLYTDNMDRPLSVLLPDFEDKAPEVMQQIYAYYIAKIYAHAQAIRGGNTTHLYVEISGVADANKQGAIETRVIDAIQRYFNEAGLRLYSKANAGNPVIVQRKPANLTVTPPATLDSWIQRIYAGKAITKRRNVIVIGLDVGGQGMKATVLLNGRDITNNLLGKASDTVEARANDASLKYRYSYPLTGKGSRRASGKVFRDRILRYLEELKKAIEDKYGEGSVCCVFVNSCGAPDYARGVMGSLGDLSRKFKNMDAEKAEVNKYIPAMVEMFQNGIAAFGNDMNGWAESLHDLAANTNTNGEKALTDTLVIFTGGGIGTGLKMKRGLISGAAECGHLIYDVLTKYSNSNDSPVGSFEDNGASVRGILAMAKRLGFIKKLRKIAPRGYRITPKDIGLAASGKNPITGNQFAYTNGDYELHITALKVWEEIEKVEAQQIILLHRLTGLTDNVVFGGGTASGDTGIIRHTYLQQYVKEYCERLGMKDDISRNIHVYLANGEANAAQGAAKKAQAIYEQFFRASSSGNVTVKLPVKVSDINDITVSGGYAAIKVNDGLIVWDLITGKEVIKLKEQDVQRSYELTDDRLFVQDSCGRLTVYDPRIGVPVGGLIKVPAYDGFRYTSNNVVPEGSTHVIAKGMDVKGTGNASQVFNLATGKLVPGLRVLPRTTPSVTSLVITPSEDGIELTVSYKSEAPQAETLALTRASSSGLESVPANESTEIANMTTLAGQVGENIHVRYQLLVPEELLKDYKRECESVNNDYDNKFEAIASFSTKTIGIAKAIKSRAKDPTKTIALITQEMAEREPGLLGELKEAGIRCLITTDNYVEEVKNLEDAVRKACFTNILATMILSRELPEKPDTGSLAYQLLCYYLKGQLEGMTVGEYINHMLSMDNKLLNGCLALARPFNTEKLREEYKAVTQAFMSA